MPELKEKTEFKVGDRVTHPVFGCGTIKAIEGGSYVIKFDRLETNRNIRIDFNELTLCKN